MSNFVKYAFSAVIGYGLGSYLTHHKDEFQEIIYPKCIKAADLLIEKPVSLLPPDLATSISSEKSTIAAPEKLVPSRVSEIMKFGYPGFDTLRTFEDFVLSYDKRNRVPHWVVEHITSERLIYEPGVDRKKSNFVVDSTLHSFFRSTNDDYQRSGYDRGHMAAAANHRKSQKAVDQTFLLTNMAPQVGIGFNRGKWNDLEKYVRTVARKNRNVYVCTGPLYLPKRELDGKLYVKYQVIGQNNVAVPTHFFKVLLIESHDGHFMLDSYMMPNAPIEDATPLKAFRVPVESIERAAGFLIFENAPRRDQKLLNS